MSRRMLVPCLAILISAVWAGPPAGARAQHQSLEADSSSDATTLKKYCVTCHNDARRTGGLSLERADLTQVPNQAETWEKVIRKLRVGMMPPPGMPKPPHEQIDALTAHATQPQYQYRHQWRRGDIVIWDNRCTMHKANADYPAGERREMHRIVIEGTVPV